MNDLTTARRQARAPRSTALALAFSVALSASVIAAPGHERYPGPPGIAPHMDSNGDATLSRREFEASAGRRFAEADQNGDGRITFEELVAADQIRREREQTRRQREHFDHMDVNADGIVDIAEFSEMASAYFAFMDVNGDGLVDASEWRPPGPPPHGSQRARQAPRTRP